MPTNQILLELSAWKARAEKAEKELAGHKRGEEILSEANQQLEKELAIMKAENTVLKMTIEHYKSFKNIKF